MLIGVPKYHVHKIFQSRQPVVCMCINEEEMKVHAWFFWSFYWTFQAPFCKGVFIRTTDSKTGAVSKLGAILGILNWDIYLIPIELHLIEIMTFAKQIPWYYSHLQQKEQLSCPEYFFDNIMNHDRTDVTEILPLQPIICPHFQPVLALQMSLQV